VYVCVGTRRKFNPSGVFIVTKFTCKQPLWTIALYNGLYTLKGNHCGVITINIIIIITYAISRFYEQDTLASAITAQVKWDSASDSRAKNELQKYYNPRTHTHNVYIFTRAQTNVFKQTRAAVLGTRPIP